VSHSWIVAIHLIIWLGKIYKLTNLPKLFQREFFMDREDKIYRLSLDHEINGVDIHSQKDSYIACNTWNFDLSLNLYHILKYEYLIKSLENRCLNMNKTTKWGDCSKFCVNFDSDSTPAPPFPLTRNPFQPLVFAAGSVGGRGQSPVGVQTRPGAFCPILKSPRKR